MHKMLMDKFKPKDEDWYQNKFSYYAKAYHLVLNRYNRNDGIDPHQDLAPTYDARNPIASLSFGRGSILTIQNTLKQKGRKTALFYQFPNDAIIFSGHFNLHFYHGVPAVESWIQLIQNPTLARSLPPNELAAATRIIDVADEVDVRYNVTIRWHEAHYVGCPYVCAATPPIPVPQSPATTNHIDLKDPQARSSGLAAVKKIVGPVVEIVPPEKPRVDTDETKDQRADSRANKSVGPDKAVETSRVDTEQKCNESDMLSSLRRHHKGSARLVALLHGSSAAS